jgi:hypothetical protein
MGNEIINANTDKNAARIPFTKSEEIVEIIPTMINT